MNKRLLLLSSVALGLALNVACPSSGSAKETSVLTPTSGWSIKPVNNPNDASQNYCALSRSYDEGLVLTLGRNAAEEYSLAIDFQSSQLNPDKSYSVTLQPGPGQIRAYELLPASQRAMVVRLGYDNSFFKALEKSQILKAEIAGDNYEFNASEFSKGRENLENCMAGLSGDKPTKVASGFNAEKVDEPQPLITKLKAPVSPEKKSIDENKAEPKAATVIPKPEKIEQPQKVEAEQPTKIEMVKDVSEAPQKAEEIKRPIEIARVSTEQIKPETSPQPVREDNVQAKVSSAQDRYAIPRVSKQVDLSENIISNNDALLNKSLVSHQENQGQNDASIDDKVSNESSALATKMKAEAELAEAQAAKIKAEADMLAQKVEAEKRAKEEAAKLAETQKQQQQAEQNRLAELAEEKAREEEQERLAKLAAEQALQEEKQRLAELQKEQERLEEENKLAELAEQARQEEEARLAALAISEEKKQAEKEIAEQERLEQLKFEQEVAEMKRAEELAKKKAEEALEKAERNRISLAEMPDELPQPRSPEIEVSEAEPDAMRKLDALVEENSKLEENLRGQERQLSNFDERSPEAQEELRLMRDQLLELQRENKKLYEDARQARGQVDAAVVDTSNQALMKMREYEKKLTAAQSDNLALAKEIEELRRMKEDGRLAAVSGDWDLEKSTKRYNEAEREIKRLGMLLEQQRTSHRAEKAELEEMLFDPAVTDAEQRKRLAELEQQLAQAESKLKSSSSQMASQADRSIVGRAVTEERVDIISTAPRSNYSENSNAPSPNMERVYNDERPSAPSMTKFADRTPNSGPPALPNTQERQQISRSDSVSREPLMPPVQGSPQNSQMAEASAVQSNATNDPMKNQLQSILNRSGVPASGIVSAMKAGTYNWRAGNVSGKAEIVPVGQVGTLDNFAKNYISQAERSCNGDFASLPANNVRPQSQAFEIACIGGAKSMSSSVVFTQQGENMMAIAHDAPADQMDAAMDARDRVAASL